MCIVLFFHLSEKFIIKTTHNFLRKKSWQLAADLLQGVSEKSTAAMLERVGQAGGRVSTWDRWRVGLAGWERAKQLADSLLSFPSQAASPKGATQQLILSAALTISLMQRLV